MVLALSLSCAGAREVTAASAEELLRLLDAGTLTRATSGTLLNEQSSRSHAIFTIIVEQTISSAVDSSTCRTPCPGLSTAPDANHISGGSDRPSSSSSSSGTRDVDGMDAGTTTVPVDAPLEYRCAKFHLVDLAGSERASRSGAAGARLREAVHINQVLP